MILVVGSAGQVARTLVARATGPITSIGRPQFDIADESAIAAALDTHKPRAVINCAAYTAVDRAETETEAAMQVNGEGPALLARACAQRRVPLVHISTDYVFSGDKKTPYVETDPTGPINVYGSTKLEGERGVLEAGGAVVVARTSWVHGPLGQNFVRGMLRHARTRDVMQVIDDQVGCPTYADDLAAALLTIAERLPDATSAQLGVFHVAGTGSCSWRVFAEAIFAGAAKRGGPSARVEPTTTAHYPTPSKRPANSQLDCGKLAAAYGVTLPAWRDSLETCLDRIAADGWPE